jgi:hypothetical protein
MMADLPETSNWETGIYQIETTDPVVGGPPNLALGQGITNVPPQQLANRTIWLRDQITALQTAVGGAATQADIDAAINALIGGAPAALDTLNELAAALADDASYAATITTALAGKVDMIDNVLTGAIGARQTPPTTALQDWNAPEHTTSGISKYLLFGGWLNGPGTTGNYHVMNFEYSSRSGGGNVTQVAIPYRIDGPVDSAQAAMCIHYRIRQSWVWSPWFRVLNDQDKGPDYEAYLDTWTVNTAIDLVHGLGAVPSRAEAVYVCKSADGGWAVGDEIPAKYDSYYSRQVHLGVNATTIRAGMRAGAPMLFTPAADPGTTYFIIGDDTKWGIKVRAWK